MPEISAPKNLSSLITAPLTKASILGRNNVGLTERQASGEKTNGYLNRRKTSLAVQLRTRIDQPQGESHIMDD